MHPEAAEYHQCTISILHLAVTTEVLSYVHTGHITGGENFLGVMPIFQLLTLFSLIISSRSAIILRLQPSM